MAAHGAPWYVGGDEDAIQWHGGNMQDQYVGNESDYRKYALIRALGKESSLRIGICWMKNWNDDPLSNDRHQYLSVPQKWEQHDSELFQALSELVKQQPTIDGIEGMPCMEGIIYFSEPFQTEPVERARYMRDALNTLTDTDLIFLDPDSGINISGARDSSRHLRPDEAGYFYRNGKSLLIYQSEPWAGNITTAKHLRAKALSKECPDASIRIFAAERMSFFLVVHPDHQPELIEAAERVDKGFAKEFLNLQDAAITNSTAAPRSLRQ